MVSGTHNITKKIREAGLTSFYDAGGAGLESRFVNWIVNSLKPGGRGFIVLPKSMLARVDRKLKSWIRRKCIVDALVYLPERTFYITPNPTYILAVTKKYDAQIEQTDPIFCYYIRDIGETRDVQRGPAKNDLVEMVDEFQLFKANKRRYAPTTNFCRVIEADQLGAGRRWDIDYLWTPQDLAELGVEDTNIRTCDSIVNELEEVKQDLQGAQDYISALTTKVEEYKDVRMGDRKYFKIHRGTRVTVGECKEHPGDIPVVSSGRYETSYLGTISETYLTEQGYETFRAAENMLTVGSTGAVGSVHMRKESQWFLHDDALAIEVVDSDLVPEYVRFALQQAINYARFDYTAKLYSDRLKAIWIKVPIDADGRFDKDLQQQIARAYEKKEKVDATLKELAEHLQSISIEF